MKKEGKEWAKVKVMTWRDAFCVYDPGKQVR